MKKWMKFVPIAAVAAAVVVGVANPDIFAKEDGEDVIEDRIFIGETAVGGMTADEASDAVESYIDSLADQTVTLTANDMSVQATAADLGLSWGNEEIVEDAAAYGKTGNLIARYKAKKDLENEDKVFTLTLTADADKVAAFLEEHAGELNREAVDCGLTRENGSFVIVDGATGVEVNADESVNVIDTYFASGWVSDGTITLATEETQPRGTEEELSKVQDVLGTFSTNYSSSASGRKANVRNGAGKINGSVVYPDEEFSVYETVQPFTAENGYELAGSYENGTTVETYGGGICQVSTTLYNAVIRAELEVTERSGHSMLVGYVDPSADAAIAGTYKDLKFKNNTGAPIYIEGYADGATLTFTVYGQEYREEGREVSFVSETLSTTNPTVQYVASSAPIGSISKTQSSHTGKTAQLWKVVTINGVEQSREIFNKTSYQMSPTKYSVGVSSSSAEATAAMQAAIATQNESTIRAAASQWSASAIAARQAAEAAASENTEGTENTGETTEGGSENTGDTTEGGDAQSQGESGGDATEGQ